MESKDNNTLLVHVGCARGLYLKNHSSLDAFVTVILAGKGSSRSKATTEIVKCEADCRFEENFEFKVTEKATHLIINVQHKSRIGGSDMIGKCEVSLDEARRNGSVWYPLKKKKDDDKYRGEVQLGFVFSFEKPSMSISSFSLNKIEKDSYLDKMKRKMKIGGKPKMAEDSMSVTSGISSFSVKSTKSNRFFNKLNKTFGGLHKSSTLPPGAMEEHSFEDSFDSPQLASQSYANQQYLTPPTFGELVRDREERTRSRPESAGSGYHMDTSMGSLGHANTPGNTSLTNGHGLPPISPSVSTAESFHRANSIRSVASSGFGSSKQQKTREGENHMSNQDLLALVDSLRLELRVKDSRLKDMEEYVDNLITRVMERSPELLAVPPGPQKPKRRYF